MKKFYTIEQIAQSLVVSTRTVRRWIKDKLLIAHRIKGVIRVSEADFAAFFTPQTAFVLSICEGAMATPGEYWAPLAPMRESPS
jgi:excisionase family DNA binding protein